jgi:glycosyltransferase involved in cell wall biosynthesis
MKGIEDAIEALAIVKNDFPHVSLNIVGNCPSNYKLFLQKRICDLKLINNITFTNFFPVHYDMLRHVKKAKHAILPIKLDVISSTVIEAILLDLPVVTYKTTGTPYLNREKESVLISNISDVQGLADNMIELLNNPKLAETLKINAKEYIIKTFDNTKSVNRLVADYYAVIEHYNNRREIPEELLFDVKEFPLY